MLFALGKIQNLAIQEFKIAKEKVRILEES